MSALQLPRVVVLEKSEMRTLATCSSRCNGFQPPGSTAGKTELINVNGSAMKGSVNEVVPSG